MKAAENWNYVDNLLPGKNCEYILVKFEEINNKEVIPTKLVSLYNLKKDNFDVNGVFIFKNRSGENSHFKITHWANVII